MALHHYDDPPESGHKDKKSERPKGRFSARGFPVVFPEDQIDRTFKGRLKTAWRNFDLAVSYIRYHLR
jgi:hypothetical protein